MSLLDEHGDEIEADLAQYYNGLDLTDLYRGTLSIRRLGVLVRQLPPHSRTVAAVNDGQSGWTITDHLIADVWAAMVKLLGDQDKTPADIDHPTRAAMVAKAVAAAKEALKAMFLKRKSGYAK